jgi:hypothetical protein
MFNDNFNLALYPIFYTATDISYQLRRTLPIIIERRKNRNTYLIDVPKTRGFIMS